MTATDNSSHFLFDLKFRNQPKAGTHACSASLYAWPTDGDSHQLNRHSIAQLSANLKRQ